MHRVMMKDAQDVVIEDMMGIAGCVLSAASLAIRWRNVRAILVVSIMDKKDIRGQVVQSLGRMVRGETIAVVLISLERLMVRMIRT